MLGLVGTTVELLSEEGVVTLEELEEDWAIFDMIFLNPLPQIGFLK